MLGIGCSLCAYFVDNALMLRQRLHDWTQAERERVKAEQDAESDRLQAEHRQMMAKAI